MEPRSWRTLLLVALLAAAPLVVGVGPKAPRASPTDAVDPSAVLPPAGAPDPACAPAGDLFLVETVDEGRQVQEPVIAFGPDGSVSYAGMTLLKGYEGGLGPDAATLETNNAGLWRRDASGAWTEENPPTFGGWDAVVYQDGPRRFFIEQGQPADPFHEDLGDPLGLSGTPTSGARGRLATATDAGGWGAVQHLGHVDRPWFAKAGDGLHLMFNVNIGGSGQGDDVVDDYTYDAAADRFEFRSRIEHWRFGDLVPFADGSLAAFFSNPEAGPQHAVFTFDGAWREAVQFELPWTNAPYGNSRLAPAPPDRLYALVGGIPNIPGERSNGTWLITLEKAGPAWREAGRALLTRPGTVSALPSAVAGVGGHLGILWYEARVAEPVPDRIPAPPDMTWSVVYRIFDVADPARPEPAECWVLDADAFHGEFDGPLAEGPGDVTTAIRQPGSDRLAFAWTRQVDLDACPPCQSPVGRFGLQVAGPGVDGGSAARDGAARPAAGDAAR